jgi:eukaryotic-like serine/threonine-protein kinase
MRTGDRIGGKYTILQAIGSGGMASVYSARNELTGAEVAVKHWTPKNHSPTSEATEARFRQEARIGATLNHRNIVRVMDLLELPHGALALVLERLSGRSLAEVLKEKKTLEPIMAVGVAVGVLDALARAHASSVLHRDLKPSNIFLSVETDGVVVPKLLDFGIAKLMEGDAGLTVADAALGTPRYMSPEQIRHLDLDARSDLFSLASVTYEMMVGRSPFAAEVAGASIAAVLERDVDPDPAIPPRLWLEISRCLAKRPYERHASAAELAQALLDSLDTSRAAASAALVELGLRAETVPVPAQEPSSRTPERQSTVRYRGIVGGVLVACVAVGVAAFASGALGQSAGIEPRLRGAQVDLRGAKAAPITSAATSAAKPRPVGVAPHATTARAIATKPGF